MLYFQEINHIPKVFASKPLSNTTNALGTVSNALDKAYITVDTKM